MTCVLPGAFFSGPPADAADRALLFYTLFFSRKKEKGSIGAAETTAEKN